MDLTRFLTDDDAVSPVIGVILMVAVTVILAAVIGTFVLDVGESQEASPTVTWEFDYTSGANDVTVTHAGGDEVTDAPTALSAAGAADSLGSFSDTKLSAGDTFEATSSSGYSSGDVVKIVWVSTASSDSNVVGRYTIP